MMKKVRKFLGLLITFTMVIGVIPLSSIAAESTASLVLNEEKNFAVSEGDSAEFTFTAPDTDTYIMYFKEISEWPIGLQCPENSVEYQHGAGFQGHVAEMTAGDRISICFLYPNGELPEDYNGYTGIVGVAKKAETFSGFYAVEEPDNKGVYSFAMQPQIGMNFLSADPLCYGVTWAVSVEDETILALDTENSVSEPTAFYAMFLPNQPGETNVTVSATYEGATVEQTYRIRIIEGGEDIGQDCWNEFASFEELKQLISDNNVEGDCFYTYTGMTPLVISEEIKVNGSIIVPYTVGISGIENLTFVQDHQRVELKEEVGSISAFTDLLDEVIANHIENEHVKYLLYVTSGDPQTLNQSVTIPSYVNFNINAPSLTVAADVTITAESDVELIAPVTLNGALVNNGWMLISQRGAAEKLDLSGGKYSGSGELQIVTDLGADISDVMTNSEDFDVIEKVEWDDCTWILKYAAGLIKLGTPTDLSWGTRYEDDGNGNVSAIRQPGVMGWKTVRPDQARGRLKIYDAATDECVFSSEIGFDPQFEPAYRSDDGFLIADFDSGTYYFTIQSLGDYETYRNSDVAVSGTYTYVRPPLQLNPCDNLYWEKRNDSFVSWAHFELPENELETVGYEVSFYFSPDEFGDYEYICGNMSAAPYVIDDSAVPLDDFIVQSRGAGYYKFRVRILSPYIEEYCSSEWSDFSPALDVKTIPGTVNNVLDSLLNDPTIHSAAPNQIRQAVQALNTMDLKEALLTDQNNTAATAKLAALENLAGGPAPVTVTSAAAAFNPNKVSIVGANLNNNTSEEPEANPITLILDKPAANHVIPERYDSAVAVKFSMTLSNVEDPEHLAVPVKITLPVPDSINPDFLVVFHYHEDGEVELLEPYVYEINGEYFADFVLTGFSDFVMTQLLEEESEHEHIFDRESDEECYLITPADCDHPAVYCKSCECGEAGTETFESGEPLGHCFDGEEGSVCTRCGYRLYAMTFGANQTYRKGRILGLTFCSEARRVRFSAVKVDGQVIDAENYIVGLGCLSSGTVVMLKASYLNTLDPGEHVITIVSADGEAEAGFTVLKRPVWPVLPGWFETK